MSKGKTVQSAKVETPQYQEDAYKELYAMGRNAANRPFTAYTGQAVAGQNAAGQEAYNTSREMMSDANRFDPTAGLMSNIGQGGQVGSVGYNANVGSAQGQLGNLVDRGNIREMGQQEILGKIGNYLNPYQDIVTDQGIRDLNRSRLKQLMSDQDAQIGRGAFGGSRGALLEAETNKNYNESVADFVAQQNQQAFDRATQLASADMDRQLTADTANMGQDSAVAMANQGALNQAAMIEQDRFNKLADLGFAGAQMEQQRMLDQAKFDDAMFDRDRAIYGDILGAQQGAANFGSQQGLLNRAIDQEQLDFDRSEFFRRINQPVENLGIFNSAVSGVPFMGAQSTTSQKKTGLGDVLGAGLQVASLFSDVRLKENIQYKYTMTKGYKVYTWDWNDRAQEIGINNNNYPTSGVIAQEIEKINPGAVFQDQETGYLVVNYERL